MASQSWILLCAIALVVLPESYGIQFSIDRTPGEKTCALLRCENQIDKSASSFGTKRISVFQVTDDGTRVLVASTSSDDQTVYIDPASRDAVIGSASFSDASSQLILEFSRSSDCKSSIFQCEVEVVNQQGTKNVIRETVSPGYSQGQCTCASIKEQFRQLYDSANQASNRLAVLKASSSSVNSELTSARQNLNALDKDISRLRRNSTALQASVRSLTQKNKDRNSELNSLRSNSEARKDTIARAESRDVTQNELVVVLGHTLEVQQKAFAELQDNDAQIQSKIADSVAADEQQRQAVNALQSKDNEYQQAASQLKSDGKQYQQIVDNLKANNTYTDDVIISLTYESNSLSEGIRSLQHHSQVHQQSIREHQQSDASLTETASGIVQVLAKIASALQSIQTRQGVIEQDSTALGQHDDNTDATVKSLGQRDDDFKDRIVRLKHNRTLFQQEIDEGTRNRKLVIASFATLESADSQLDAQVTSLQQNSLIYTESLNAEEQDFDSFIKQLAVLQETTTTLQRRVNEVEALQGRIRTSIQSAQVTTSTKTETELLTGQEARDYTARSTSGSSTSVRQSSTGESSSVISSKVGSSAPQVTSGSGSSVFSRKSGSSVSLVTSGSGSPDYSSRSTSFVPQGTSGSGSFDYSSRSTSFVPQGTSGSESSVSSRKSGSSVSLVTSRSGSSVSSSSGGGSTFTKY